MCSIFLLDLLLLKNHPVKSELLDNEETDNLVTQLLLSLFISLILLEFMKQKIEQNIASRVSKFYLFIVMIMELLLKMIWYDVYEIFFGWNKIEAGNFCQHSMEITSNYLQWPRDVGCSRFKHKLRTCSATIRVEYFLCDLFWIFYQSTFFWKDSLCTMQSSKSWLGCIEVKLNWRLRNPD